MMGKYHLKMQLSVPQPHSPTKLFPVTPILLACVSLGHERAKTPTTLIISTFSKVSVTNFFSMPDLDVPDAQRILDLESLITKKTDFSSDIGHAESDFPFQDALWTCSTLFSSSMTKVGHKRIFLFTNEDNPNSGDAHGRAQAIQRAKDLGELGIDIELFSMNKPGQVFDPTKFYVVRTSVSK
jgi:hypothetical protein